jgi:regulator of sirC expression with transglutaminase-like and TPR domain
MVSPAEHLANIVNRPESTIDVARGALAIAQHEYPQLDIDAYVHHLDATAERLKRRLPADAGRAHVIAMLNHYLFNELGYVANRQSYYDPRNSFLNDVIERRTGIPITLSIVYMEVARRLGLSLVGISFPGHFMVKCVTDQGVIVLDPYNNGTSLSENELRERLAQVTSADWAQRAPLGTLLKAATRKEILVRLARNLKGVYTEAGSLEKAITIINLILVMIPDSPQELRDRGVLYHKLECFRSALSDLQRFMTLEPDGGDDDDKMRGLIVECRQKSRSLH